MSYLVAFVMYCNSLSVMPQKCVSELIRCHYVFSEHDTTILQKEGSAELCLSYVSEFGIYGWRKQVTNKATRKQWGLGP